MIWSSPRSTPRWPALSSPSPAQAGLPGLAPPPSAASPGSSSPSSPTRPPSPGTASWSSQQSSRSSRTSSMPWRTPYGRDACEACSSAARPASCCPRKRSPSRASSTASTSPTQSYWRSPATCSSRGSSAGSGGSRSSPTRWTPSARSSCSSSPRQPSVTSEELRITEALFRDTLAAQRALIPAGDSYTATRQKLAAQLEHYKKNTHNDTSLPLVENMLTTNGRRFVLTTIKMLADFRRFIAHSRALEKLAVDHKLTLSPGLPGAINAFEGHIDRQVAKLQQAAAEAQTASPEKP